MFCVYICKRQKKKIAVTIDNVLKNSLKNEIEFLKKEIISCFVRYEIVCCIVYCEIVHYSVQQLSKYTLYLCYFSQQHPEIMTPDNY